MKLLLKAAGETSIVVIPRVVNSAIWIFSRPSAFRLLQNKLLPPVSLPSQGPKDHPPSTKNSPRSFRRRGDSRKFYQFLNFGIPGLSIHKFIGVIEKKRVLPIEGEPVTKQR